MDTQSTYDLVRSQYGAHATRASTSNAAQSQKIATAFGYTLEDLESLPPGANLGASCGNPLATANLQSVGFLMSFQVHLCRVP